MNIRRVPYGRAERAAVVRLLVQEPDVQQAAQAASTASGKPLDAELEAVERFAEEIVPQYSARLHHRLAFRLARRLARAAYRVRLGYVDEAILHSIPDDASVVFVMNHRSNMDYVLLSFLSAPYVPLSFAVGEWACVWPIDRLVRALGAYFVRRSSGDSLYRKVLECYVRIAVEQGVTQAVFPEGSLTKDGRLRPPKLGLLSYMTKHYTRDRPRDLVFVPVAVNYDRVLEDRTQLGRLDPAARHASAGATALGAARWLAKNTVLYLRGRLHHFGYACVNFGGPVSLKDYLHDRGVDLASLDEATRFSETERLGTVLMEEIANVIPVTPVSLVATAILSLDGADFTHALVEARVSALVEELVALAAHVYVPRRDSGYLLNVGLRILVLRRLIVRDGDAYRIAPGERPVIEYYANSIAHFFATRQEQADATLGAVREHRRGVILVHGLARTSRSMARMGKALEDAGYQVYNWDYPSRRYGLAKLAESLSAYAGEVASRHARVDFVTHSMGGLLVRAVLARTVVPNVGRVVMLAPPNQGAGLAVRIKEVGLARRFFGQSLDDIAALGQAGTLPPGGIPRYMLGIIAGTRSFHPLQPTSYFASLVHPRGTHDGTLTVDETRLPGMVDFVTVRANHTFIMDHDETIQQTLAFLEDGRFRAVEAASPTGR